MFTGEDYRARLINFYNPEQVKNIPEETEMQRHFSKEGLGMCRKQQKLKSHV